MACVKNAYIVEMQLIELKAENFKNYKNAKLRFSGGINCFTGMNGAGKTNLLDAIFVLCSGKSYFNVTDQQLVLHDENYFSLLGNFERLGEAEEIRCVVMRNRKKVIKRNDIAYEKLFQHYGEFPAIVVTPGDVELINGASDERRKWLDSTISLIDREYLINLVRYEKILQQRNAELKNMSQTGRNDAQLLEVYDTMLFPLADAIFEQRKQFTGDFLPFFKNYHIEISRQNEEVNFIYHSQLNENNLQDLFRKNLKRDIALQRTTQGTHRDDLQFLIGENALKKFGSQGQQKTFLLALKMAQHQYIKQKKGFAPLLLLDDVCERLDEQRLNILFSLIQQEEFGQVFVTDTSLERLKKLLANSKTQNTFFTVVNGKAEALK